jgi:RNA methyltransferase, TrmH family
VLSRAETRLIHALQQRKARETKGLFLAEGVRVVEELLRSGIDLDFAAVSTSLEDNERGSQLRRALEERCAVHELSDRDLNARSATEQPQGVLVVARVPSSQLRDIQAAERSAVLVVDAVQDPGNLGTLIRTADAFGLTFIAVLPGSVDPWNPKVVRASAGSTFHLPIIQSGTDSLFEWLRDHGPEVWGAELDGTDVSGIAPPERVALVVGNEGAGLHNETRAHLNRAVSIGMRGRAESLNVAVAAGILMYLLTR